MNEASPSGATAWRPGLAICNETFLDWPLERACDFAAACGYQGIEFAPFTLGDVSSVSAADRKKIVAAVAAAGLQTVGLHWLLAKTTGLHLTSPDKEIRRRTAEYLKQLAQLNADLGGSLMVLGSPLQRDRAANQTLDEADAAAIDVIAQVLPTLEECRTTLALEPLGLTETNYLNTAEQAVTLARRIDSPWCRLHLDCKAMTSEAESIPTLIHRHAADLAHFHANDPNRQGPGMGALDFTPILQALKAVNYSGWISVEVFDYAPGPERLAKESAENLRQALKTLK